MLCISLKKNAINYEQALDKIMLKDSFEKNRYTTLCVRVLRNIRTVDTIVKTMTIILTTERRLLLKHMTSYFRFALKPRSRL